MTPLDLETEEVLEFVESVLPGPPCSVLEVGCGDGRLAARLAGRGWKVTPIDTDDDAVAAACRRGVPAECCDFFEYSGGPFDAVLFTRSFHHISPLGNAVEHARELLAPGGTVVLDEFAHDEIDRFSAAWFFDLFAVLEGAGAIEPDDHSHGHAHDRGDPPRDALERWRWRHEHEPPLHGAKEMTDALGGVFELSRAERLPYLHRYFAGRVSIGESGANLFRQLRALETERIEQAVLVPVGLRVVGRRL